MLITISFILASFTLDLDQKSAENWQAYLANCERSSDCFSHEYCSIRKVCVDAAKEPCSSASDCVAGEMCNLERSPHRCE